VALYGHELFASELRLRTAIEMIMNKNLYMSSQDTQFALVSPVYTDAVRDCLTDGAYSSAWTMLVAANVMQVNFILSLVWTTVARQRLTRDQ